MSCDNHDYDCGCNECQPWNCLEQQIRDILATKDKQFQDYIDAAKAAADRSEAAAEASAESAAEALEAQRRAEQAATTAVAAEGTVTETAGILQETADVLRRIALELQNAIAGIAVIPYYVTATTANQSVFVLPPEIDLANVQSIYYEGSRQEPGEERGFVFDLQTRTVTLAKGVAIDTELTFILSTYNADNPEDFSHTLASSNGAGLVGTTDGSSVQQHINAIYQSLSNLSTSYTTLAGRVSAVESDVAAAETSILALDTSITNVEGNVTTLINQVAGIETENATQQTSIDDLDTRVTALENP